MQLLEKKCPSCGAMLDFKVGDREVTCKHCRKGFVIDYDKNYDFNIDFDELKAKHAEVLRHIKLESISEDDVKKVGIIVLIVFAAIFITSIISFILIFSQSFKIMDRTFEEMDRGNSSYHIRIN